MIAKKCLSACRVPVNEAEAKIMDQIVKPAIHEACVANPIHDWGIVERHCYNTAMNMAFAEGAIITATVFFGYWIFVGKEIRRVTLQREGSSENHLGSFFLYF